MVFPAAPTHSDLQSLALLDGKVLLPRAALKVLDAAEEYRKGVEYFNRARDLVVSKISVQSEERRLAK